MTEAGYYFSGSSEEHHANQQKANEHGNEHGNEYGKNNSSEPEPEPEPEEEQSASFESKKKADAQPGDVSEREEDQSLQQKAAQLEQEKEELLNRLMRLQADFDNYRKRVKAEKEDLEMHANYNLIQRLLPVIDNLERACSTSGDKAETIVEGVQMITRQLHEILAKEGVEPMDCKGEPFDPNCHEAVLVEENSDYPPNTVVDELQKGYKMKDRVLRASMVKVSAD